jgi:hypothetical protein
MVSGWGCEQQMVLGQIATDAKSNEQQFSFYHGDCLGGFCRV